MRAVGPRRMRLKPARRERDCSPRPPRGLSSEWLLPQEQARKLRLPDSRAGRTLPRPLLAQAVLPAQAPVAALVRAQEPRKQHVRAWPARYSLRRWHLCSAQN